MRARSRSRTTSKLAFCSSYRRHFSNRQFAVERHRRCPSATASQTFWLQSNSLSTRLPFVRETLTEKERVADLNRIGVIEAELDRWEGYPESRIALARFDELIEAARFVLDGGARNFPQLADIVADSQQYRDAVNDRPRLKAELEMLRSHCSPDRRYTAGRNESVLVEAGSLEKLVVAIRRR